MGNDKFVAGLRLMFEEALPGENVFGIRAEVEDIIPAGCVPVQGKSAFVKLLNSRADWKGVVFNPLSVPFWDWLPHVPTGLKVIWYCWGGEAYNSWPPLVAHDLYLPKTKKWVYRNASLTERVKGRFPCLPRRLYLERRYLTRVDFFVSQLREEYDLFRRVHLLSGRTKYHFGSVGALSSFAEESADNSELGVDILLGNSATPTNNHMEAIDWLAGLDLTGRKVIAPLSYGDPEYGEMICDYGKQVLGDHFEPITTFMPLTAYQSLLNRCGFVVMNHLRQAAVGNIMMMLMKGARVFLNDTAVYREYTAWGVHLDRIASAMQRDRIFTPLSAEQVVENRVILVNKLGADRVHRELRGLLSA
jgi:hypothetical protein